MTSGRMIRSTFTRLLPLQDSEYENKSRLNLSLITVLNQWGDKTRIFRVSQNLNQ